MAIKTDLIFKICGGDFVAAVFMLLCIFWERMLAGLFLCVFGAYVSGFVFMCFLAWELIKLFLCACVCFYRVEVFGLPIKKL